ncbi:MAG: SPOR domain-containing protein [Mangrovibacterium sp.]|nr:SPOR domain-containing protein [Mangrovibacterium sp.]
MKLSIAGIAWLLLCLSASAQVSLYEPFHPKNKPAAILQQIDIQQDSRIGTLLQNHIEQNKRKEGTEGYRVEIFFSSGSRSREEAMRKKTEFLKNFPGETAYMSFQSPNFKVRVGDCRTRSEALKLKGRISGHYPNAFIVPDMIQFPKLYSDRKSNE